MARGTALRKAIIDLINEMGPTDSYHPRQITKILADRRYWKGKEAKTPLRTVTSYFSDNPETFSPAYGSEYALKEAYQRPSRKK